MKQKHPRRQSKALLLHMLPVEFKYFEIAAQAAEAADLGRRYSVSQLLRDAAAKYAEEILGMSLQEFAARDKK